MDIIKISLLGICGVILGFLLKGTKPEYAAFVTMGIGIVILGLAVGKIRYIYEVMEELRESVGFEKKLFVFSDQNAGNCLYRAVFCRNLQRCRASGNSRTD